VKWGEALTVKVLMPCIHELIATPHLTLRSQLILMRRLARHLTIVRAAKRAEFEGEIGQAVACLPLTRGELIRIKQRQDNAVRETRSALIEIGAWINQTETRITAEYGFDAIYDLLGVNPIHRDGLIAYSADLKRAVSALVLGGGLEDSAAVLSGRHPAELKDGPLYQALWHEMKSAHECGAAQRQGAETNVQT
jgi:flagellar biosynthesis regulator FlaF